MTERRTERFVPRLLVLMAYGLIALGLGVVAGYVGTNPYSGLFFIACLGGLGSLLWFRLGPYHDLLIFVFVSHLLVWFLKLTSTVLPTKYVALLPSVVVGFLYVAAILKLGTVGFRVPVDGLDLFVVGFIVISFLQVFNDHVTMVFGLRGFQRTAFFAGMYFVGKYVVTSRERAHAVIRLIAISVTLAAGFAILQRVLGISLEGSYLDVKMKRSGEVSVALAETRSYGTLTAQASFGVMTALGAPCALAWLLSAKNRGWWAALASLLVIGVGLLLSGSRSSMLGLAAGVSVIGWLLLRRRLLHVSRSLRVKKRTIRISAAFTIAVVALVLLLTRPETKALQTGLNRLRTITPVAWFQGETFQDRNVQVRMRVWKAIWEGITARPILGYGTGILGGGSHREGVGTVSGQGCADNQYLELWGELGVLGLLFYCAILLVTCLSGMRRWRHRDRRVLAALVAGVAGVFVVAGIGAPPLDMYPANAFFWLLMGVGANVKRFSQKASGESDS